MKFNKEELENLIFNEKISYEEIGRRYEVSGSYVRKAARKLGIVLPQKRKINPKENFSRNIKEKHFCLNCGEILKKYYKGKKYCSIECEHEYHYKKTVESWLNGDIVITSNKWGGLPVAIKRYLMELRNNKCEKCGWGEINQTSGKIPLEVHHIDGDCTNNKIDNLQLLCPNCHSLTENFGVHNFGKSKRYDLMEYKRKRRNKNQ